MSNGSAICLCTHWDFAHSECIDNDCTVEGWHIQCDAKGCDCHEYRTDDDAMRGLKEGADERKYRR